MGQRNLVETEPQAPQRLGACDGVERPARQYREIRRGILEHARTALTQMPSIRALRKVTVVPRPGDGDDDIVAAAAQTRRAVLLDAAEQDELLAGEIGTTIAMIGKRSHQPLGSRGCLRRNERGRHEKRSDQLRLMCRYPPAEWNIGSGGNMRSSAKRIPTANTSKPSRRRSRSPRIFWPARAPELRPGDAANHQDQRQHRIDEMIGGSVHHGCRRHGDQREHHRRADHRPVGTRNR